VANAEIVEFLTERRLRRLNHAVVTGRILPYLAFVMALITLAAALAVRLFARGEFTTLGESIWWAAQTVTTVGYGDVIPETTLSKVVAVFVMFFGIAAVSLTTAIVTSAVMNFSARRLTSLGGEPIGDPHLETLHRIEKRLDAIEHKLG
jgi:voltage-gated potassium channel